MATCDRCGSDLAIGPFPFRYMDANNPRADQDGYYQPVGCAQCLEFEQALALCRRLKKWGFRFLPLRSLAPWIKFKRIE